MWGTAARVGYARAMEREMTLVNPAANFSTRSSSVSSRILGSNTDPSSYTFSTINPYENGLMPSFERRADSDDPTFSPFLIISTGTRNEGENSRVAGVLSMHADGALHHGVLTHEDDGITTEPPADVLELLGPYIVGAHHQYLRVVTVLYRRVKNGLQGGKKPND
nr:hypothetical protein G7K_5812-T1 [Ipomoea batatas]